MPVIKLSPYKMIYLSCNERKTLWADAEPRLLQAQIAFKFNTGRSHNQLLERKNALWLTIMCKEQALSAKNIFLDSARDMLCIWHSMTQTVNFLNSYSSFIWGPNSVSTVSADAITPNGTLQC